MVRSAVTPIHVTVIKAVIFAGIWYVGVCVEMGVPVFLALTIYAMFTCGTGKRWSSEESAYSVFNEGSKSIAGTMTAAQIDAQMRNGGHAPRTQSAYESSFVQSALRGWGGGSEHGKTGAPRAGTPADDAELLRRRRAAADAAQARAARA